MTTLPRFVLVTCLAGCECGAPSGGERADDAGPGDAGAALDTILQAPPAVTGLPTSASFEATWALASFECRLDDGAFEPCTAPTTWTELALGPHRLDVRATADGQTDETPASADFTVVQLVDHPNLAIVEAYGFPAGEGGFTIDMGLWPSQLLPFYDLYPDDYVSAAMWTDFPVVDSRPIGGPLRTDVAGIGLDGLYRMGDDRSGDAGSDGRLEGAAFMQSPQWWEAAATEFPKKVWGERQLDVLLQEFGHRWLAYFPLPWEADPSILRDWWGGHWDFHVGLDAPSPMKPWYGPVEDLGDGTFRIEAWDAPSEYSSADLYGLGLLAAEEVPDFFFVRDATPAEPPANFYDTLSWTFSGERVDVSMTDVVEALGPRDPPVDEAPKSFRQAFVLVVEPGAAPRPETLDWLDEQRRGFEVRFSEATRGLGTVDTALWGTTRGL